jgi:hypothetical protein
MSATATRDRVAQADRARLTIWRLFDQGHMSASVATCRLLSVDLAVQGRTHVRGGLTARSRLGRRAH